MVDCSVKTDPQLKAWSDQLHRIAARRGMSHRLQSAIDAAHMERQARRRQPQTGCFCRGCCGARWIS